MTLRPFRIVNVAEASSEWQWIANLLPEDGSLDWKFFSALKGRLRSVPGPHWGRIGAALQGRKAASSGWANLVVSHGPYTTFYVAAALATQRRRVPQVAMSFNFTDLPVGMTQSLMAKVFQTVDRFAIFSRVEKKLYSERFDLPAERFDFVRWGVAPPIVSPKERVKSGRYFVALGGEARDYATLLDAARRLPLVSFVFIVRPWSLAGMSVPDNVEVHVNLPWQDAWSYVWHSEAALLPLRSSTTPNGHVTIVGGMHLNKAHIVTDSDGIRDYASKETALLVPAKNVPSFTQGIERLMDEPELARSLGSAAGEFARENCTEDTTANYFRNVLARFSAELAGDSG